MRIATLGAIATAFVGLVAWKSLDADGGEPVEVAAVTTGPIEATVMASGRIEPHLRVEVRPEVAGAVATVEVEVGDQVAAGQRLLTLEASAYRADYDQQLAAVRMARSGLQVRQVEVEHLTAMRARYLDLHRRGAESRERVDDLTRDLRLARARRDEAAQNVAAASAVLQRASLGLDKAEVRAPRPGVVTAVDVDVGEAVLPGSIAAEGSTLVTLADTSSLIAELHIDEADIRKVGLGQRARIYPIAYETEFLTGTVRFIAPRAERVEDRKTRTFLVKIALDASRLDVRPGMSCRAEILVETRPAALRVPGAAVVHDESDGRTYVLVVAGGRAVRTPVAVGIADDTHQQIVSGVTAGAAVVTGPYPALRRLGARSSAAVTVRR